jgi:hypothetical protein
VSSVSCISLVSRGFPLGPGGGTVHGGDRLPWVKTGLNLDEDNFAPLASLDWQVHVYGDRAPDIQTMRDGRKLPLHVFPWRAEMRRRGLRRHAVYLVRPDGYVALADTGAARQRSRPISMRTNSLLRGRPPRPPERAPPRRIHGTASQAWTVIFERMLMASEAFKIISTLRAHPLTDTPQFLDRRQLFP